MEGKVEQGSTDLNARPNPTDLVCWWCVHALPSHPCIHAPIKYDEKLKRYAVVGNFCSWACAKAYLIDTGHARKWEFLSYLAMMRLQSLGKYVPLFPAPRREALKCFGGTMTIEEFRSYGGHVEPPRVHFPFEKLYFVTIGSGNASVPKTKDASGSSFATDTKGKLTAIETASSETETLRLKRNKPLVRSESKLENALGLKRREKGTAS